MDCPSISDLKLSNESKQAIKRIKDIPGLANQLSGSMAASQIISIFVSPTPTPVTLNSIRTNDWVTFSAAMASVPKIAKASVVKEAEAQWFNAQLKHNFKESNFWKAVANGCTIR